MFQDYISKEFFTGELLTTVHDTYSIDGCSKKIYPISNVMKKSTITLFTTQFAQSSTEPRVTVNNSLLALERTPRILVVTIDPNNE